MSFNGWWVLGLKSSPFNIQRWCAQCAETLWLRASLLALEHSIGKSLAEQTCQKENTHLQLVKNTWETNYLYMGSPKNPPLVSTYLMFRSVVWGYGLQIQLTDAQTNSIEGNMSSASLRITGFSLQFDSLSYTKAIQVFEKGLILGHKV